MPGISRIDDGQVIKQNQSASVTSQSCTFLPSYRREVRLELLFSTLIQEYMFGLQNHPFLTYHTRELQSEAMQAVELSMETQTLHSKSVSSCLLLSLIS